MRIPVPHLDAQHVQLDFLVMCVLYVYLEFRHVDFKCERTQQTSLWTNDKDKTSSIYRV